MNEYIFYTVEGYTYPPREDKNVANCQLLGTVFAKDVKEAREKLEKEEPWIKDCGFDMEKPFFRQLLSEENIKDISIIVQYLTKREFLNNQDKGKTNDDICNVLMRLKKIIS